MIRFAAIAALLLSSPLSAATSYLLLEGGFGPSQTLTTYEWQVNYTGTQITNGQDLMNVIFGAPDLSSTGGVGQNQHVYSSSNTINGITYTAQYTYFDGLGLAPKSFSVAGLQSQVNGTPNPNFFWNYLNAGGGYNDVSGFTDPAVGPYPAGTWTFGNTGFSGRTLADQSSTGAASYDALVFGQFGALPNSAQPNTSSFASATVINLSSVPEPGRALLMLCAMGALAIRRRR